MNTEELSQLLDVILDDLSARFIINLPEEELSDVTRICFALEQAHWFYEDFFRPQYPALPSVNLRQFTAALFSHCPMLWPFKEQHETAFDDFMKYKIRVPVRGAIMLNHDMTQCVLVRGWKSSAGWGFPKGKIDKDEDDSDCAVREIREECGFDISDLVKSNDFIEMVIKEQQVKLYIVREVPMDTSFEPQTRKEIGKIDWFKLDDLPTYNKEAQRSTNATKKKYYMVAPFLGPLRTWIKRYKKAKKTKASGAEVVVDPVVDVPTLLEDQVSFDESSQALKLLLGISERPEGPVERKAFNDTPSKHDLLAMLQGRSADAPVQEATTPSQFDRAPQISDSMLQHGSPARPPGFSDPRLVQDTMHQPFVGMPQPPPGPNPMFQGHSPQTHYAPPSHAPGMYPPGPPMFVGFPGMPPYPAQHMQPPPFMVVPSGPFAQQMHPMPPPNLHLLQQQHLMGMHPALHPQTPMMHGSPHSAHAGPVQQLSSPQRYAPVLASPQPVRAVPMPVATSSSPSRKTANPNAGSLLAILKPKAPAQAQDESAQEEMLAQENPVVARETGHLDESPVDPLNARPLQIFSSTRVPSHAQSMSLLNLLKSPVPVQPAMQRSAEQVSERMREVNLHSQGSQRQPHAQSTVQGQPAASPSGQQVSLLNLFRSTPPPSIKHLVQPERVNEVASQANQMSQPINGVRPEPAGSQASLLHLFKGPSATAKHDVDADQSWPQPQPKSQDYSAPVQRPQHPQYSPNQYAQQPAQPSQSQHLASLLGALKPPAPPFPAAPVEGSQPAALFSLLKQKPAEQAPPLPPKTHQQSLLALLSPTGNS
ncbi:Dcp2, box A domain-domain-containing protein [Protomyces lactucae-debilis]|uniref:Dcp2, box A domain-domain-containing protein n=1 Tax=Protomyces lactucae-debilis TaxID=2754530 RepID=A0A1Y2FQ85_PROLT|nr:Dcp2, box A domain-containing protein [Protomyces lactucae-debilis]ORY86161.1 Dcp2, box A domain-domain-containing protein [Protomyces lactucae-debilis]